MVLCGADRLEEYREFFDGGRVGLITTPTGRLNDGCSTIDALKEVCNLKVLFGAEHGIRGDIEDAATVEKTIDKRSGLPVYSLYEGSRRRMTEEMLDLFDIIVYDIQDVGSRYYTFISSLKNVIEDCASRGKRVVVLDRPDPLGGVITEGNVLAPSEYSFVGCYSLPVRYGLTPGEFALMVNKEMNLRADVKVVPCLGWERESFFDRTGLNWIMPSPNIPNLETALVYVGTCLLEGTNMSEGRGTANPFQVVGAPYIKDPEELAAAFNNRGFAGICATPYYFVPYTSKHQGKQCGGLHIHITDWALARPFSMGLALLQMLKDRYEEFQFLSPVAGRDKPFIQMLSGMKLHEGFDVEEILGKIKMENENFIRRKEEFHLYD
ncbi:MAG: DUF1343 domain-containing protein [Butyrivibrio sp.]|nr:DUF1343 domain-containing protein [Butyrivibrio sp.]